MYEFSKGMEICNEAGLQTFSYILEARWKPPPEAWIKINTDGACVDGGARIAYGGVIRDHKGYWIRGVVGVERLGSVLSAELKGVFQGLKLARQLGYKKVCLESDSENALTLVENGCSFQHDQNLLVKEITELLVEG